MTAVVGLTVAGTVDPWERIGLDVSDDGTAWIGGIALHVDGTAGAGIASWTLQGGPQRPESIDGLATRHAPGDDEVRTQSHPLGVSAFDHVVVMTSSLERTCRAIEDATGEPLKRIREAGTVRQGFHRLGPVIVEVVESAQVAADVASFWGFVLVVDDLADVCDRLGPDVIGAPRAAVQPGRSIASFRREAGLGLPVALMSR